ncbi:MAG: hypothetical protein HPY90_14335 [Syntrophothermus sp.]|uniref:hypothetical protein n=1 Tax=Syntrophothermus sp. TaxID=2736299 RepID=UPI00257F7BF4|nr:hypothetical protein [Syntrophothermus sp.]NSW84414.1 hypothetical protein [Syntrophothermus sp.]
MNFPVTVYLLPEMEWVLSLDQYSANKGTVFMFGPAGKSRCRQGQAAKHEVRK